MGDGFVFVEKLIIGYWLSILKIGLVEMEGRCVFFLFLGEGVCEMR